MKLTRFGLRQDGAIGSIDDVDVLACEAEAYRHIFNTIRRHEALDMRRPAEVYLAATPNFSALHL